MRAGTPSAATEDARRSGGWLPLLGGCVGLAALSLLVFSRNLAYDPWSWVIWGREIAHLDLNTRNAATAVKPLPMLITTVLAPTGSWAPVLWLLISRAGALLAVALAFRLGRRLGGVGAGLIAAVGLAACDQYLDYLFIAGMSEPLAVAAMLAAVDSHLRSRHRAALAGLVAAGLLRPEAWFFVFGYSLWLAYRRSTWHRVGALALSGAVPASWFVIDWFGSRQLFRSAGAAKNQSQGGPLLSREPGLATLRETWHLVSAPIEILFILGLAAALLAWARGGQPSLTAWFGLAALGWVAVAAVMAQARIATGAPRYLLPGAALACIVAGGFAVDVIRALIRWLPDSRAALPATLIAVGLLGLSFAPRLIATGRAVNTGVQSGRQRAHLQTNLSHAIAIDGGRERAISCGPVSTERFQVPLVAWQLHLAVGEVLITPMRSGTVLQDDRVPGVPLELRDDYRYVGASGQPGERWTVLASCPATAGR